MRGAHAIVLCEQRMSMHRRYSHNTIAASEAEATHAKHALKLTHMEHLNHMEPCLVAVSSRQSCHTRAHDGLLPHCVLTGLFDLL